MSSPSTPRVPPLSASRPPSVASGQSSPILTDASGPRPSTSAVQDDPDETPSPNLSALIPRPRRLSSVPVQEDPSDFLLPSPTDFVTRPSDEDALAFLFNTVVSFSESHRDTARGWHAELRDVYTQHPDSSLVKTAARATSLALLGSGRSSNSMVREGLVVHGQALTLLREALQDPVASRSDATLLAVLLMSHFDFVVYARESRPYLDAHGRILPALLKHRGTDQLQDPRSRRLFYNVQLMVVNSRLYGSSHFGEPDDILLLDDDSDHPGAILNNMLKKIFAFQHTVALIKTRPSSPLDVQHALESAFDIDRKLVNWASNLRPTWQFSILGASEAKLRPQQYWKAIHKYPDLWICRIWNSYRTARVELHTSLWNLMIWSSANHGTDHTDEQLHSQQIIQRMVDEVAASVPYGFGDVSASDADKAKGPVPAAGVIKYKSHASTMGWFLLNPILRVCLKAPHIPEDEREWLKIQLVKCCKLGMIQAGSADFDFFYRQKQPAFSYSMPIVTMSDSEATEHQLSSPTLVEESLPSDPPLAEPESSVSPSIESGTEEAQDASASQSSVSSLDLKFINTTRPGQTKDEGVQKKIRRDVMLDYHRKNTRKKIAERQQQQRGDRPKSSTAVPSLSQKPK